MRANAPGVMRRSAGLRAALTACCVLLLTVARTSAQVVPPRDEGIVEVVAERLAPLTLVVLVDSAGSVLLPVESVTRYLGLPGSWSGSRFSVPGLGGSATIDTASGSMTTAAGTTQLAPAEMTAVPVLHLRSDRLAELLDATVTVDFAALAVVIAREVPFPSQQRIVIEQRRAVLMARQAQVDERQRLAATPYTPVSGVGIADWEIATNGLDPSRLTTFRTDAGIALLGGDLNGSAALEVGRDAARTVRDATMRYHRVFPHGRLLTQVRAGDVLTTGLFARHLRGAEISNRPFLRTSELSSIVLEPDLPTGWGYEVFRGGQLLGYSDLASTDPVAVPLHAGATPVQIRMYGPAGEEVIRTLLYQTPVSLLRSAAVEYVLGAGRCSSGCDEFAHADIRYGVTPLFTAGGGFELFSDSTGPTLRPYFVYSLSTGTRATAELTYMPFALYSANIALFPRETSSAHLRGSISRPGFGPVSLVRDDRMRWDSEVTWDERLERTLPFSRLRFGASAAGRLGQLERWRVSTAGSFSRGFLEARYDHDRISISRHLLSARAAVFTPVSLRGRTLRPLVNVAAGVGPHGIQLGEIGLAIQPRSTAIITAAAQWNRGSSRPALSIGYSAHVGSVQSALRAVSAPSGRASSSFRLSGSSALTHDGSITVQPLARTGYAGLRGTVFVDNDQDGEFSDGDTAVPDIHLIVAGHRAVTDHRGRFRVWGLQPWLPAVIAIDSARTADPGWTTAEPSFAVRPAPNVARRTDIRLVRTRELIGAVTADPDIPTVAGISLVITGIDSDLRITTTTFSDGQFYISRIPPGHYRVAISPSSLDAVHARTDSAAVAFVVAPVGDDPIVELPPIHLSRRR